MKKVLLFLIILCKTEFLVFSQIIVTVAGTGAQGYSGDGGAAINAKLYRPTSIKSDNVGSLYFCDSRNNVIRKINTSGIITTVVGTGILGYSGDGGPAINATLRMPTDIAFDNAGNLYIADGGNNTIRVVNNMGIISTIAGIGIGGFSGDGGAATSAKLADPFGLVFDKKGNLLFSDGSNHRIRKITPSGMISTIAGTGTFGYSGDGGAAIAAEFKIPCYLAINATGEIMVPDYVNNRVRKIDTFGIITTIVGNGVAANTGDGTPAITASIQSPGAILIDDSDNLIISTFQGYVIRKVNKFGIISTIAGIGTLGYSGDGGPATDAQFNQEALCTYADTWGNLYITDRENQRIRRINYNTSAVNDVPNDMVNMSICPNPTSNEINIQIGAGIKEVTVLDVMGRAVASIQSHSKQKEIIYNVTHLPSGIYFVKVNGVYTGKFVKE